MKKDEHNHPNTKVWFQLGTFSRTWNGKSATNDKSSCHEDKTSSKGDVPMSFVRQLYLLLTGQVEQLSEEIDHELLWRETSTKIPDYIQAC